MQKSLERPTQQNILYSGLKFEMKLQFREAILFSSKAKFNFFNRSFLDFYKFYFFIVFFNNKNLPNQLNKKNPTINFHSIGCYYLLWNIFSGKCGTKWWLDDYLCLGHYLADNYNCYYGGINRQQCSWRGKKTFILF